MILKGWKTFLIQTLCSLLWGHFPSEYIPPASGTAVSQHWIIAQNADPTIIIESVWLSLAQKNRSCRWGWKNCPPSKEPQPKNLAEFCQRCFTPPLLLPSPCPGRGFLMAWMGNLYQTGPRIPSAKAKPLRILSHKILQTIKIKMHLCFLEELCWVRVTVGKLTAHTWQEVKQLQLLQFYSPYFSVLWPDVGRHTRYPITILFPIAETVHIWNYLENKNICQGMLGREMVCSHVFTCI